MTLEEVKEAFVNEFTYTEEFAFTERDNYLIGEIAERYAKVKVKEEIEYREFLGRCYGDKNKLIKQMQDLIIKYSEGTITEATHQRIKKYQRIKKRAECTGI